MDDYEPTTIDKATHFTTDLIPGIQEIQGFNKEKTCVSYKGGTYIGVQWVTKWLKPTDPKPQ
jgi:hypothetical protein